MPIYIFIYVLISKHNSIKINKQRYLKYDRKERTDKGKS